MTMMTLMTRSIDDNSPETPAKAGLSDGGRVVLCILAPLAAAAAARVGG